MKDLNTYKNELHERVENLLSLLDDKADSMELSYDYSQEASDIVLECIDELRDEIDLDSKMEDLHSKIDELNNMDDLEEIEQEIESIEQDIEYLEIDSDTLMYKIDECFIYYYKAWEYLQEHGITDFEDAFNNGYTDVCSIATYYLMQELGY